MKTGSKVERRVAVVGATGTVGSEVVAALGRIAAAGVGVRALVRSARAEARVRALQPAVELVRGDLRDGDAVRRLLDGVDAALYVSPHEPDEEALADGFVTAAEASGARIVFVGVHLDGGNRLVRATKRLVFGRMLAHYRPKFRLSERVRQSATRAVVLMPTNFFQNDELFRDEILGGRFLPPMTRPVNRVDVRDLGEIAARALVTPDFAAGAYPVVGPASLTGAQCAEAWSRALGRAVVADDSAEVAFAGRLAGKKAEDFDGTYRVLRGFALPTDAAALAATTSLLGRPPISYETWVRHAATGWASSRAA